jgi:hypothetical protein
MPSPRPLGLGVWKILLFPQHLHDDIFGFIIFIGYVLEPIVCPLLWCSIVRDYTHDLFVFIGFCLLSLAHALAQLPLPLLWWLSAVSDNVSWFLTMIADDFSFVSRLSLSFPPIILCAWFCLFFGSCESGPCTSWRYIHSIWISVGWCDTLPLLLWLWSRGAKIIDLILQMDVSFLCFECLVTPLFICLRILVHVYEVIHFTRQSSSKFVDYQWLINVKSCLLYDLFKLSYVGVNIAFFHLEPSFEFCSCFLLS